MRQNSTLLLLLCSLGGFAQFYVAEGTTLGLESPETILSSQEARNQINAPITGTGTFYLNATSHQTISSTQSDLSLPNFQLENADFISIRTALSIQDQLIVKRGQLTLSHNLTLTNPTAVVLGKDAYIHTTTNGQLVYRTQIETSNPLAVIQTIHLFKHRVPPTLQASPNLTVAYLRTSNFGRVVDKDCNAYFKHETPPPKAV